MFRTAATGLLLLFASVAPAAAEWHFTPLGGLTMFGSTSMVDLEGGTGKLHLHAGMGVSWLSRGIFGVETLTIWTPKFFEGDQTMDAAGVTSSRALSVMGNVVVTLPQRWTEYGLRPFVSGGFGLMHANATDESELLPVNINVRGLNIGGGAIGFLTERTGIRFDVRYHSTLNRLDGAPAFGDAHLRYVTASVGVVIRR